MEIEHLEHDGHGWVILTFSTGQTLRIRYAETDPPRMEIHTGGATDGFPRIAPLVANGFALLLDPNPPPQITHQLGPLPKQP